MLTYDFIFLNIFCNLLDENASRLFLWKKQKKEKINMRVGFWTSGSRVCLSCLHRETAGIHSLLRSTTSSPYPQNSLLLFVYIVVSFFLFLRTFDFTSNFYSACTEAKSYHFLVLVVGEVIVCEFMEDLFELESARVYSSLKKMLEKFI